MKWSSSNVLREMPFSNNVLCEEVPIKNKIRQWGDQWRQFSVQGETWWFTALAYIDSFRDEKTIYYPVSDKILSKLKRRKTKVCWHRNYNTEVENLTRRESCIQCNKEKKMARKKISNRPSIERHKRKTVQDRNSKII